MAHNEHFLGYTAMMEGRREAALDHMQGVVTMFPKEFVKENAVFMDAFMTAHLEALKRFGEWQAVLDDKAFVEGLPVSTAHRHMVRAIALSALGRVREAEKEAGAFRKAAAAISKDAAWGSNTAAGAMAVGLPYVEGEIAYRKGNKTAAIAKLREAVALEDGLKYDEPPAWTVPTRHSLGAVLIASRKYADAEGRLPRGPEALSRKRLVAARPGPGPRGPGEGGGGERRSRRAWPRPGPGPTSWWTRPASASGPEAVATGPDRPSAFGFTPESLECTGAPPPAPRTGQSDRDRRPEHADRARQDGGDPPHRELRLAQTRHHRAARAPVGHHGRGQCATARSWTTCRSRRAS
jgi:hypothetical protein